MERESDEVQEDFFTASSALGSALCAGIEPPMPFGTAEHERFVGL
jgi:hypothetical protein